MKKPQFLPVIQLSARTKAEADAQAAELAREGMTGFWVIQCLHDDFCRAIHTHRDADCVAPCQPDFILMSFEAHANFMEFDARMRKAGCN